MAVTNLPKDKFAFLFSGSTNDQYLRDLEKVYETLKNYYNYPKENIWVIEGRDLVEGDLLLGNFPGVSNGVVVHSQADLQTKFTEFAAKVQSNDASLLINEKNTVLLYFTSYNPTDLTPPINKNLFINTTDSITLSDFKSMVDVFQFSNSQVNVIMQQSYCGIFDDFANGMPSFSSFDDSSFTGACSIAQTNPLDDTGSAFTKAWVAGLQFGCLPSSSYADQLLPANPVGYDQMISLEQAKIFADQKNSTTYVYDSRGTDPVDSTFKFLGRPILYLRDGNQQTTPDYWWESPDIYLHHPNHPAKADDDLYITDLAGASSPFNNIINVKVRNVGTHPVRSYCMFVELYRSGLGYSNSSTNVTNSMLAGGVLKPVQKSNIDTVYDVFDFISMGYCIYNRSNSRMY